MTRVHPVVPPATDREGHSWAPSSPCTPDCLPTPESLPGVGDLRVAARLIGLLMMIGCAALVTLGLPLVGHRRNDVLRWLFRTVLRAINVRVVFRGASELRGESGEGVLVVANHISWLDILVLGAVHPMRMVAKREIREYPVLGSLGARIGTLFIDRNGLRTLPGVVDRASAVLRDGGMVGLFPEGTTWCGAASGVFRRAVFQAALDAGVPVRPVAQRFVLPDGTPTTVGSFIGNDTLLDSLLRVLRLSSLTVAVEVLPLLVAEPGTDRRELARRAELALAAATGVPAPVDRRPASGQEIAGEIKVPLAA